MRIKKIQEIMMQVSEENLEFFSKTLEKIKLTEKRHFEKPTYETVYILEDFAKELSEGSEFRLKDIKTYLRTQVNCRTLSIIFFSKFKNIEGAPCLAVFYRYTN
jgi:hypothetical protein